jgi:16S rRNA (adenine1518-N6/adenine1519-N6)-dimethyltransferase
VRPGDHVVEIGAGFGSLTLALAATGAEVLAIEFDRGIVPALREVTASFERVRAVQQDVMRVDWEELLADGSASWVLCANLPYNISVPLVADVLASVPPVRRLVVMVQREVGERLAAAPGDPQYGAVSVRVAYRATTRLVRRVPASVFWPKPAVDSIVVRLDRRDEPPVAVDETTLWRVVDGAFAERRKTMRNALRRLGSERAEAEAVLAAAGVAASARPETLGLTEFAAIAEALPA